MPVRTNLLALLLVCAPAHAQAETLREAMAFAYANNPTIMSALLDLKASAEGIALAKSGTLPSISVSASTGYEWTAIGSAGSSATFNAPTLGARYEQTLFDNFRTEAEIERARALTEVSKYALRNQEQNVLFAVVQAYFAVLRDTQLVELRAENMTFFEAQVASAEERLSLSEGTRIEVSQARARLAAGVAAYQSAIASLQTSRASYERWVGHGPKHLSGEFRFDAALPSSLDTAIASSEEHHPAVLSARAAIRVAQAGSDATDAAYGPSLNLVGSLCALNCFDNAQAEGMSGSVNVSLSVPIYAGGALGASIRKANIEQIRSEVDALGTRDQVREAVISAWSSLTNALAQIESAELAVASGEQVVDGVLRQRDAGQQTTLDVLNAQAELISAKEGLIQARAGRMVAAFALLSASGRLTAADLRLGVETHSADGYIAKVEDAWQELRTLE